MAVSKRLRFEILRRDNHACRYCGRGAPEVTLTVDHVVPTTLGGRDDPTNLVAACVDCNAGKASVPADAPTVADVAADALRWAAAMQAAAALAEQERDAKIEVEKALWTFWEQVESEYRKDLNGSNYLPDDWYLSVHRFLAAGLTKGDLLDASHITLYGRRVKLPSAWKYFCGVCWRMVTERQTVARQILDAEEAENERRP